MTDRPPECPECYREMRLQATSDEEDIWHCAACSYHLVDRTIGETRRMTARYVRVQGKCPHGCGDTLEVNLHNRRHSCGNAACPDRHAVQRILDHDQPHHIVQITEDGWVIKHPLLERVEDRLFDCAVGRTLAMLPPPKGHWRPADYEVTVNDDGSFNWRKLEDDGD